MSHKGHTFTTEDAPKGMREDRRPGAPERLQAWLDEQTAKNRIVGQCMFVTRTEDGIDVACGRNLVSGETMPHRLNHASNGNVRAAAGTVLRLKPDEIAEVLEIVRDLA